MVPLTPAPQPHTDEPHHEDAARVAALIEQLEALASDTSISKVCVDLRGGRDCLDRLSHWRRQLQGRMASRAEATAAAAAAGPIMIDEEEGEGKPASPPQPSQPTEVIVIDSDEEQEEEEGGGVERARTWRSRRRRRRQGRRK